jgi:hypothetical protein
MLPFAPLTFVSLSSGTISGIIAETAGICIPAPKDRTTDTAKSSHVAPYPAKNNMATTRVDKAIKESESITSFFLSNLSAHTPAKGEIRKVGTNPQIIEIVIIMPDLVSNVMYHVIAYWTNADPKNEMAWLDRNSIMFLFQLSLLILLTLFKVTSTYVNKVIYIV